MVVAALVAGRAAAQDRDPRQLERIERMLRLEGDAVVALADRADAALEVPSDFLLTWHNDFLKAELGTFVPFVVSIVPVAGEPAAALLYVRVAPRQPHEGGAAPRDGRTELRTYPVEDVYPVELAAGGRPTRVSRGFAVGPGEYDLTVVVRERDGQAEGRRERRAAVLRRAMRVPDYSGAELATSTIMLADAVVPARDPAGRNAAGHPYVVGSQEIQVAPDSRFRRDEELIVVFLVYNPSVTTDEHFDLEVEYHFLRRNGGPTAVDVRPAGSVPAALPGETYVNRTEPQRFNPSVLGPGFQPRSGQPVMAGQGVPLAGFEDGDYRLAIRVTDRVSGRSLEREVTFTVGS